MELYYILLIILFILYIDLYNSTKEHHTIPNISDFKTLIETMTPSGTIIVPGNLHVMGSINTSGALRANYTLP